MIEKKMYCSYCDKEILLGSNVVTYKDTDIYYHADCYNKNWTEELNEAQLLASKNKWIDRNKLE